MRNLMEEFRTSHPFENATVRLTLQPIKRLAIIPNGILPPANLLDYFIIG
jgi:hypothetical protein